SPSSCSAAPSPRPSAVPSTHSPTSVASRFIAHLPDCLPAGSVYGVGVDQLVKGPQGGTAAPAHLRAGSDRGLTTSRHEGKRWWVCHALAARTVGGSEPAAP